MKRRIRRVHFVGIGGVGMSALAELMKRRGYEVRGSDLSESPSISRLRRFGVEVAIGHDAAHLAEADLLVYSSAVPERNPERARARSLGVPSVGRGELLAELMRTQTGVAVAGSHGKTTTSALIAHLLEAAGLDPTVVIGGRVCGNADSASGVRLGTSEFFVAEADESDGSFLRLSPAIAVVTNVDAEHLEHYGRYEAVQEAFLRFTEQVPFWGLCVLCADDPGVQPLLAHGTRRIVRYGLGEGADLAARDVEPDSGGMRFRVTRRGEELGSLRLPLPGRHNVANALAALAVALELNVPFARVAESLERFRGVARRFERKGSAAGIEVIDDYAHHPAELRATLAGARSIHDGRIVAIFQPHRYSRTRDCFDQLTSAFEACDLLIVNEIYAAGEGPVPGVDGRTLAEAIAKRGHPEVRFLASLDETARALPPELRAGDWVFTLGAGDITDLGPKLLARLREAGDR